MITVTPSQSSTPPDEQWAQEVCLMGRGSSCCSFLGNNGHWACMKKTELAFSINERRRLHTIGAMGDNCEGRSLE